MDLSALVFTPIKLIPPEILVSAIGEVTHEPVELMQLALVCRTWRDVVLGTSELWSHVTVTSETNKVQLLSQLRLSGQALLALIIECDLSRDLAELISGWDSPRPIVERVSSLQVHYLYTDQDEQIDAISVLQQFFEGHTWLKLKKLVLGSGQQTLVQLRAPNLETVDLNQVELRRWSHIGLGSSLRDVRWAAFESYGEVTPILSAVAHCRNLRRLELNTSRGPLVLPELPKDAPLWLGLVGIDLRCMEAGLADILTLFFHAPHLTMLRLVCDIEAQPFRQLLPILRSSSSLRKLSITLFADSDNRSDVQMLGLALLQGVFDIHDLSALIKIKLINFIIPQCWIPALGPQLQEVVLTVVVLPYDFIERLNECISLHRIVIYESTVREVIQSGLEEYESGSSLVFSGSTFTGAFTQLRIIRLSDVTIFPEFIAHLSQYSHLEEIDLRIRSIGGDLGTTEINRPEVGAIIPLPKLRELDFDFYAGVDTLPLTPAVQYILSAAAQLASRMSLGIIRLRPAPLRADDVVRLLLNPGRDLSNIEILFKTDAYYAETLKLSFEADTKSIRYGMPQSFRLEAAVMQTELASIADIIFDLFPLYDSIYRVCFDLAALTMVEMAKEQSAGAAGLEYLLRCAAATANRTPSTRGRP